MSFSVLRSTPPVENAFDLNFITNKFSNEEWGFRVRRGNKGEKKNVVWELKKKYIYI